MTESEDLIREAREWPRDGINEGRLINALADELEAAHRRLEFAWRDGYFAGKRDYAGSVMGGCSVSTPNPYSPAVREDDR